MNIIDENIINPQHLRLYDNAHNLAVSLYKKYAYSNHPDMTHALRIDNVGLTPFYNIFPVLMKNNERVGAFVFEHAHVDVFVLRPHRFDEELKESEKYFGMEIALGKFAHNNYYLHVDEGYHIGYAFVDIYGFSMFKEFGKKLEYFSNYTEALGNIDASQIDFVESKY